MASIPLHRQMKIQFFNIMIYIMRPNLSNLPGVMYTTPDTFPQWHSRNKVSVLVPTMIGERCVYVLQRRRELQAYYGDRPLYLVPILEWNLIYLCYIGALQAI